MTKQNNSCRSTMNKPLFALSSERGILNKYEELECKFQHQTSKTTRLNKSDIVIRNYEFDIEKCEISLIEKCPSSKRGDNTPNKSSNSLMVCVICFQNPPNAVFMNCGHGGNLYSKFMFNFNVQECVINVLL